MPNEMKELVLLTTNSQFTGGVPKRGAKDSAELFGVTLDDVRKLEIGEFFGRARRQTTAFKFKVGKELVGKRNAMSKTVWQLTENEQLRAYYRDMTIAAPERPAPPPVRPTTTKKKKDLGVLRRPRKQV